MTQDQVNEMVRQAVARVQRRRDGYLALKRAYEQYKTTAVYRALERK